MFTYIKKYIENKRERKQRLKEKTESLISGYEKLIQEFKLIQLGQSKLSSTQRKMVRARIVYLVSKGHITVNDKIN